jgi:nondiscriminating aspartyl-tRNA synthetase
MQRTLSTALASRVGRRATVQGWVHRRRRLARVSFLIIRDRGGLAQVVLGDEDGRAHLTIWAKRPWSVWTVWSPPTRASAW